MKRNVEKYEYDCLNDAKDIMKSIGMPPELYNPRCVMTLAACAKVKSSAEWKHASEAYVGTHEIISFINEHFPDKAGLDVQGYKENSRETFRDETLKRYVAASLMEPRYGLANNDRNNAYRLTAQFAALIRHYGTDVWDEELEHFKEIHQSYSERLKQVKDVEKGYKVDYGSLTFNLGRSQHNKLQKLILEEFAPIFAPGAELLYIGDTSDRKLCVNEERMSELGINVLSDSAKLPDIILYDGINQRVLFVEAYSSTGEFNIDRVDFVKSCLNCPSSTEVAFVTAFHNTKKMLSVYHKIAWDTDIWVAEDPTHMTHKNGDKFIGRPL